MKNKFFYGLSVILLIAFIVISMINQPKKNYTRTFFYLGTIIEITLFEEDDETFREISDLILKYDNMFNRLTPSSDVALLNSNKKASVSEQTKSLISTALHYSDLSDGYFDITINPIVSLWNIGTEEARIPNHEDIKEALTHVNYKNVLITNQDITLLNDATIDLGGIAKGYITDEIVRLLKSKGHEKALINLGGNVYALGSTPSDEKWTIGIRHPEHMRSDAILSLRLTNKSIVTSGIYERFFEEDQQIYHHLFNPFTGYPVNNDLLSLTVISDHSIDGDALSTALFNLGTEKAFERAEELNVAIIVINNRKEIIYSSSLKDIIELFDTHYSLKQK